MGRKWPPKGHEEGGWRGQRCGCGPEDVGAGTMCRMGRKMRGRWIPGRRRGFSAEDQIFLEGHRGRARLHPHQNSPSNHSRDLSIYKNWQIYSAGAHFQEAKGEGERGEVSSPFPFSLILFSPRGKNMTWTPKPTQIKNQKTEVPKSYSILIPHRKGGGAREKGTPWGGGRHPQPGETSPPLK